MAGDNDFFRALESEQRIRPSEETRPFRSTLGKVSPGPTPQELQPIISEARKRAHKMAQLEDFFSEA